MLNAHAGDRSGLAIPKSSWVGLLIDRSPLVGGASFLAPFSRPPD